MGGHWDIVPSLQEWAGVDWLELFGMSAVSRDRDMWLRFFGGVERALSSSMPAARLSEGKRTLIVTGIWVVGG